MLPFGALMARNAVRDWNASLAKASEQLNQAAAEIAHDLSVWLSTNARLMEQFAQHPAIAQLRCDPWLKEYMTVDRTISSIAIIRADGQIVCDLSGPAFDINAATVRERAWFKDAVATDGYNAGNVMWSTRYKAWTLPSSFPIRDGEGRVTAYLFVGHILHETPMNLIRYVPQGAVAGVLDGNNVFIIRSVDTENYIGKKAKPEQAVRIIGNVKESGRHYVGEGPGGEDVMVATATVPGTAWTVYTTLQNKAIVAEQRQSLIKDSGLLASAMLFILLIAYTMSRAITKPIVALRFATQAAATNKSPTDVSQEGPTELRDLALNFNALMQARDTFESNLEASEKRYRELVGSIDAVVWEADAAHLTLNFVSDQAERLLGYPKDAWTSDPSFWASHVHPDDRDLAIRTSLSAMKSGGSWEQTYRMIDVEGRIKWVRNLCKLMTEEGRALVVRGVTVDITEQVVADERLKLALDAAGDSAWDWDVVNNKVVFSDGWYELMGYRRDEFGETLADYTALAHPDDIEQSREISTDVLEGRQTRLVSEHRLRCKDGSWKWILSRGMVIARDAVGNPLRMVGTHTDLTSTRAAEGNRKAALQQYSDLVSAARDPIIAIDRAGMIQLCNQAAIDAFGYTEAELLKHPLDVLLPSNVHAHHGGWITSFFAAPDVARSMAQLRTVEGRHKDGTKLRLQVTLAKSTGPDGDMATAVIRDVTEIENLHEQLHQADKLAAIGQLTGGVAHDINNLLAVMMGSAELIHYSVEQGSTIDTMTKRIVNAGKRGAELIRRLLVFSRKANVRPEDINLPELLVELIDTLGRTLGSRVQIEFNRPEGDFKVHVDRSMLESCLINLSVNARDAMPEGGKLIFALEADYHTGDKGPEDWVVLTVTDSGTGMPEDVKKRVFEPFFTTKPLGSGTGLGLSMVYGFVQQSGGEIMVESEVGLGTTFEIRFPRLIQETQKPTPLHTDDANELPGRGRKVLLVEDNDFVRETYRGQLERLGCSVIEAATYTQARHVLMAIPDIKFVFADFDLGTNDTGVDLAEWIKNSGRNIPGAIISGYLNTPIDRIAAVGWSHLMKPSEFADLAKLLKSAGKNTLVRSPGNVISSSRNDTIIL